jgi:hypothetical protein
VIHVCRQYTHGEFVEFPKTDAGARDIGIDTKLTTELGAWKLAQKAEHRKAESLVVATSAGGPISASNFLQREFYPALEAAQLPAWCFTACGTPPRPSSPRVRSRRGLCIES